ncbi:translation initiation factor IF-2-like [Physeter macrocephalus]|uniref:Translation initiation factor IF-2-like n=1 Tax=Physeter macrocephalus TaxID=9755 RepID=A0A455BSU3_PHYMC|nr:translation initiation factor IF-2-like [Physeter catodon]|eukprot:XP_028350888.1 uncharacterized protein LOC114487059 [Physeter catodon]
MRPLPPAPQERTGFKATEDKCPIRYLTRERWTVNKCNYSYNPGVISPVGQLFGNHLPKEKQCEVQFPVCPRKPELKGQRAPEREPGAPLSSPGTRAPGGGRCTALRGAAQGSDGGPEPLRIPPPTTTPQPPGPSPRARSRLTYRRRRRLPGPAPAAASRARPECRERGATKRQSEPGPRPARPRGGGAGAAGVGEPGARPHPARAGSSRPLQQLGGPSLHSRVSSLRPGARDKSPRTPTPRLLGSAGTRPPLFPIPPHQASHASPATLCPHPSPDRNVLPPPLRRPRDSSPPSPGSSKFPVSWEPCLFRTPDFPLSLPHGPLAQFSPYPYRQTFSPYLVGNFKV